MKKQNYLKSYRFSTITIAMVLFIFCNQLVHGAERSDLYEDAKESFEKGDIVVALKKFYAFQVLNEEDLANHKDLNSEISMIIEKCETELKSALEFRNTIRAEKLEPIKLVKNKKEKKLPSINFKSSGIK